MNWFEKFSSSIRGEVVSSDLVGAGTATAERAMSHYRYQHQAKVREAIEETFPMSFQLLGDEWNFWWKQFWASSPASPRSLDFFGEHFVDFMQIAPKHIHDMLRFEWAMEILPWVQVGHGPRPLTGLSENSKIELYEYQTLHFSSPVTTSYEEEKWVKGDAETVIIWMKDSSVYYRAMQLWELEVLSRLSQGVEEALVSAPEDASAVSQLFQWLGESHLIRAIHNM